ncbi:hypothetical protein [Sphingomonas arenae]|uniref:hypothetical protein n=1 Tax=Sphingomonas arenae TaxID=2812555 RepID=UPI001967C074|nr:hypothetical protein [Sphingomonas arenae]
MRSGGMALMILSGFGAFLSFIMDTTVYSYGSGQTHNLGLLQTQMMVFQLCLAGFVGGAVLYGSGEIAETHARVNRSPAADTDQEYAEEWDTEERNRKRGLMILFGTAAALLLFIVFAL